MAFTEFQELMGATRTHDWVTALLALLDDTFPGSASDPVDRERLFYAAHLIVGRAGIVGCADLVEACVKVQEACRAGSDLVLPYCAALLSARQAVTALRGQIGGTD